MVTMVIQVLNKSDFVICGFEGNPSEAIAWIIIVM